MIATNVQLGPLDVIAGFFERLPSSTVAVLLTLVIPDHSSWTVGYRDTRRSIILSQPPKDSKKVTL